MMRRSPSPTWRRWSPRPCGARSRGGRCRASLAVSPSRSALVRRPARARRPRQSRRRRAAPLPACAPPPPPEAAGRACCAIERQGGCTKRNRCIPCPCPLSTGTGRRPAAAPCCARCRSVWRGSAHSLPAGFSLASIRGMNS
ncbi:hypothetical protein EMIHUDRAFT_460871 [Emiliania huxleyi CCMP1516]|uniref:Uncharacterized protein n=2 Tax=Emiliania huxleyi TaxID=2903 RepID=A0A0D3I4T8_EMIH1|nr:hypothetical protein EMIHUDRAFT_460871 [Emiliania huxleyi CCMP1516]EOD06273.1 hypothetical protein EMIHUDRAFT_460871 [Emiliania huxleyi CCMP1516]|eukprot:XP_005758702.1 hypothetical protein EMIHUDRAFT_460871 [Emiliania huxleyi CCMP1516]